MKGYLQEEEDISIQYRISAAYYVAFVLWFSVVSLFWTRVECLSQTSFVVTKEFADAILLYL